MDGLLPIIGALLGVPRPRLPSPGETVSDLTSAYFPAVVPEIAECQALIGGAVWRRYYRPIFPCHFSPEI